MPEVIFYPSKRSISVEVGTTISQAARWAGVLIESPCNCAGTCGKCKVRLDAASLLHVKQNGRHNLHDSAQELVLSCETEIWGDIAAEVLYPERYKAVQVQVPGKYCLVAGDRSIRKLFSEAEQITRIFAGDGVLAIEAGNTESSNFGVVFDIGTTTLVASLIDITTGEEIAAGSELNPQSHYAQDVLSRIKYASEQSGLHEMSEVLLRKINGMLAELISSAGIEAGAIYEAVFSGNTCMLHLALGLNPAALGRYPYTPLTTGNLYEQVSDYRLLMAESGVIYIPPIISAYIGADITSGILATDMCCLEGVTLLVDIGTNGEIVMGDGGALYATSAAAGPAFEGMNIACGMRAARGAVEGFAFDEESGITVEIIDSTVATGICGSGLLDVVGELVAHGVINRSGRFCEPCSEEIPHLLQERLVLREDQVVFKLTEQVFLSQQDVRQVQLAKGALRAGIELLLQETGNAASAVDRVFIAGTFGYHLRENNLLEIGLLPAEFAGKIDFVGNTSLSGGQALLMNRSSRSKITEVVKNVRVIEQAQCKDFDRLFVRCLGF